MIWHVTINALVISILSFVLAMEESSRLGYRLNAKQSVIFVSSIHLSIKIFQLSLFYVFIGYIKNFWNEAMLKFPNCNREELQ